jgi:hypothetical protein
MYHIHQNLRAHFSGRNRGTPELRTGADTLIRPAHANATTAGCRTTGRPRTATIQNQTHRRNWQCVNTVKKTIITTSYPLFWASAPKGAKHSHLITYGHSFRPYVRTSVRPYVRTSVRPYVCTYIRNTPPPPPPEFCPTNGRPADIIFILLPYPNFFNVVGLLEVDLYPRVLLMIGVESLKGILGSHRKLSVNERLRVKGLLG